MRALSTWLAFTVLGAGAAAGESIDIGQQVKIDVAATGAIVGVKAGEKDLANGQPGGFSVVEVLPPDGKTTDPEVVVGKLAGAGAGKFDFAGRADKAKLAVKAQWTCDGTSAVLAGNLVNEDAARDRAVQLDFVVPIKCDGWTYESGLERGEKIAGKGEYPAYPYGFLNFRDGAAKGAMFKTSMLWFNCVWDGQAGLAIGVAPDSPAAFWIGRDPRGMFIRFQFGLTAATEKFPNKAQFKFVVYGIDGRWGIRSAAEHFYKMFPASFTRRADKFGSIADTGQVLRGADLPNKQDFGFTYTENDFFRTDGKYHPGEGDKVRQLGLTCFQWREPWSYFLTGSDPQKTAAEELQLLKDQASGKVEGETHSQMCGAPLKESAQGVLNSYMTDSKGELLRVRFKFKCRLLAVNMDPQLPKPNRASLGGDYQFRWMGRWADKSFDGPRAIAWDSCTTWTGIELLNYRREQFKSADYPLTYDKTDGRVCQMKALTDRAYAVWQSKIVHDAGGLTMGNMSFYSLLFIGDCIDVGRFESSAPENPGWPQTMGLIRLTLCQKPFSYYALATAVGLRHALLYGLAPGGDCQHEEYRPIAKKYMPALQTMAKAGWQPVTWALSPAAYVERYGDGKGPTYLAVANRSGKAPADVKLAVDCGALKLDPAKVKVAELIEGREATRKVEGGNLVLQFKLEADESLAFRLE